MARFKIGVHLRPQHTTIEALRTAWKAADALGVDSISVWDHFHPLQGDPAGPHFECWSMLAAMAIDTKQALIGPIVCAIAYRNPDLLAHMACTVDHLSGGRLFLGVGAGNSEHDHVDFAYGFPPVPERMRTLREALPRIKARLPQLNPPPIGRVPLMIGGAGEKVTLRLVAQYADMANIGGPPDQLRHKNRVLDDWCARLGRDPKTVERTSNIPPSAVERLEEYVEAGGQRLHIQLDHPYDMAPVDRALKIRG
jgi:probable F420-dependent oxidoreductase